MSEAIELVPLLKKLRLSGILQTLELRVRQATEDGLPYGEFLLRLLADEVERREAKQLALRLRRASFEQEKTIGDFRFEFNPRIPKARIVELATCAFVGRRGNVCLLGPAGTGKTHLAQALGHRACQLGHSVLFTTAHRMLKDLRSARADRSYEKRLLKYTAPDLLIVDDLGIRPLEYEGPFDLDELIRGRYERGSIVVTSNRAMEEWPALFGDELLASSAIDRLLHHAEVIVLEGRSYRTATRPGPNGGRKEEGK